jgi:glycosyltransferase involved in cell wall biosynthesis
MRTLVVFHLAEAGGPAQHLRPWLAELALEGTVDVVAPAHGSALALYKPFATTSALAYRALTVPATAPAAARAVRDLARETRAFYSHIKKSNPDVVVVVTTVLPSAVLAAKLARVPTVVYAAEIFDKGFARSCGRAVGGRVVATLHQRLADAIVACSETVARQFSPAPGQVVKTIYPGIDASAYAGRRADFRRTHELTAAQPCILVAGNITRGRGQDVALRALAMLRGDFPDVHCVIAGNVLDRRDDRAYRRELGSLVERLGLEARVTFLDFVSNVADLYAAADVVVNPARFNEPFGRVAIEALAAGRPVVATRVGAIPEVLRDGLDALLVPPDDPAALAAVVARVWTDSCLRGRLVHDGRERVVAEFPEREAARQFADVVRAAANGRQLETRTRRRRRA